MFVLDTLDRKIVRCVTREPKSATDISVFLKESRTTVMYRLRRLQEKRVVRSARSVGTRIVWSTVEHQSFNRARVMVFEGDEFAQVPRMLALLKKGSVVYNIIGTKAMRLNFKNVPEASILESQRLIKRRRLIIKMILHDEGLAFTRTLDDSIIQAYSGRTLGYKGFVSRTLFSGAGEVIVTSSFILISNLKNRRTVIIRDRPMVALIYEMLALLFDTLGTATPTRIFDFQKHLDAILAERARSRTVEG